MKHVFTLLLMSFVVAAQAQFQLGLHYGVGAPLGTLGENIQPIHSVAFSGAGKLNSNRNFSLGAEFSLGTYAHKQQQQTFISPEDGSSTTTDVDFSSNMYNFHVVAGYEFTSCTNVIPYVTMKAGVSSFSTEIVIQDPGDHDSCSPLDQETLFNDAAFSVGAGAGVRIDAGSIFKNAEKRRWWFDFSANYLWGTSLDYINVKYLNPGEQSQNLVTRAVTTKFVHLQSQHVHEHQIAQVYNSNINLLNFKIGVVRTFGGCKY